MTMRIRWIRHRVNGSALVALGLYDCIIRYCHKMVACDGLLHLEGPGSSLPLPPTRLLVSCLADGLKLRFPLHCLAHFQV